jgi:hypothetical protein
MDLEMGVIYHFKCSEFAPLTVDSFQTECHGAATRRTKRGEGSPSVKAKTRRTKDGNELGRGVAVMFFSFGGDDV